jgi:WD40 repeat protein
MALAPDASALAVFEHSRDEVSVLELPSGKPRWAAPLPWSGWALDNGVLAFSPGGKLVALSHDKGDVRVWEARTGRLLHTFAASKGGPVAFSPDSRKLAFAHKWMVEICDLETDNRLITWKGDGWADALAWSADRRTLLACEPLGAEDNPCDHLSQWDVTTGKRVQVWCPNRAGEPYTTALSRTGKLVAVLRKDARLEVQDAASGREVFRTPMEVKFQSLPEFSSNGRCLVGLARDVLYMWDTMTWKLLRSVPLQPGAVDSFVLSADGDTVAFRSRRDSAIHVWNLDRTKPLCELPGHRGGPLLVAFSADGSEVVTVQSACSSGPDKIPATWSLRRWDAATCEEKLRVVKEMGEVEEAVVSGDGRRAGLVLADSTLALWDTERGQELRRWALPSREDRIRSHVELTVGDLLPMGFAFTLDGQELLAGGHGRLHRWDTFSGRELPAQAVQGAGRLVLFSSRPQHHAWLKVNASPDTWLQSMDVKTGRLGPRFPDGPRGASDLAVTTDGRTLAAVYRECVPLWEMASGSPRGEVPETARVFGVLALSPDCRLLAATAANGTDILLWDLAAGKARAVLKGHREEPVSLAFSPDSRRLVSGSAENVAYIWDVTGTTPAERLDDKQLEGLWRDLHSPDAACAYRAIWRLAGDPEHGVPFLRQRLLTPSAEAPRMARLIEQLSDDSFKVREAASTELARFGTLAVPALVEAKKGKQSAEAQTRINSLLSRLPAGVPPSAQLVGIRVIESLERAGTPEGRKALEEIGRQKMWRDEIQSTLRRMGGPARAPRE